MVRDELCTLIGWDEESQRWSQNKLFLLAFSIMILIARLAWIANTVGSDASAKLTFIPPEWSAFGRPLTFFLASVAMVLLWFVAVEKKPLAARYMTVRSRRSVLISATVATGGLLIAAAAWTYRDKFSTGALGFRLDRVGRLVRNAPRYLTKSQKENRYSNRNAGWVESPHPSMLAFSNRPRRRNKRVALHFTGKDGRMKLPSAPSKKPGRLLSVNLSTVNEWLSRSSAKHDANQRAQVLIPAQILLLNPIRTTPFEEIALGYMASNDLEMALGFLLAGAELTLQADQPNLRILDLLAGLALKSAHPSKHLDALIKLAKVRLEELQPLMLVGKPSAHATRSKFPTGEPGRSKTTGLRKASSKRLGEALASRVRKWSDKKSMWYVRWSERHVWWHHPTETRQWAWKRTKKMDRPPINPEARQRPIKLGD